MAGCWLDSCFPDLWPHVLAVLWPWSPPFLSLHLYFLTNLLSIGSSRSVNFWGNATGSGPALCHQVGISSLVLLFWGHSWQFCPLLSVVFYQNSETSSGTQWGVLKPRDKTHTAFWSVSLIHENERQYFQHLSVIIQSTFSVPALESNPGSTTYKLHDHGELLNLLVPQFSQYQERVVLVPVLGDHGED